MVMNHLLSAMILQVTSLRLVVFTKIHAAGSPRRWARQLGNLQKCWVPWPTLEPGGTGPLTTVTTSLGFDATFGGLTVQLNSLSLISTEGGKSFDTIFSNPPFNVCMQTSQWTFRHFNDLTFLIHGIWITVTYLCGECLEDSCSS